MKIATALAAILAALCAAAATAPARACALSGMSSDCDAACSTIEPGWRHTACIIGATPPAEDEPAR
ncbi:hypothetical protein ACFONL_02450 [Camelimonas fluminis]|uniref:Uncharacterized protein n=1 Tax=Camelimonas fluminis TaxID=1576911 RepID=A0ABV7UCH7_9HYPH|nr:hypothetical protein [Camelimonas fluminis]